MASLATARDRLLCVDLDGTLLATDVLWELFLILLKTKPLRFLLVPFWLLKGKAFLKRQLAKRDFSAQRDTVNKYQCEALGGTSI